MHVPASKNMPLLSATFTFDDHIRCMAAKQRLTRGGSPLMPIHLTPRPLISKYLMLDI